MSQGRSIVHSRSSKRKLLILFSAIVFLFPAVATLLAREWSSADGKFKVEAEFVALRNGKVVLEKKNGEIISVPLERLSEADIAYVEEQTGAEIPKKVSPSSKEKEDIFGAADDDGKPEMKERGSTEVPTKSSNSDSRFGLVQPIKLKGEKESDPAGICRTLSKEDRGKGSIAFSADGAFLVCTFSNATMKMYDVNNSTTVTTIPDLRLLGEIKSTRFTDNGKMLLTGSEKGIILCWTVSKDGQLESTTQFAGHTDDVTCISIAKDNNLVISGGHDKKARVWQISDSKELAAVEFKSELSAVWVSPDGNDTN